MILFNGRLDYARAAHDLGNTYLFTGNSFIKRNGALVMGRGAALEVRDMYPGIDKLIGLHLTHLGLYGLCLAGTNHNNLGVFQVKRHFSEKAELDIIKHSVESLNQYARAFGRTAIYMNYPGVGFGGLLATDVAPLLTTLPDNVFLYKE